MTPIENSDEIKNEAIQDDSKRRIPVNIVPTNKVIANDIVIISDNPLISLFSTYSAINFVVAAPIPMSASPIKPKKAKPKLQSP